MKRYRLALSAVIAALTVQAAGAETTFSENKIPFLFVDSTIEVVREPLHAKKVVDWKHRAKVAALGVEGAASYCVLFFLRRGH